MKNKNLLDEYLKDPEYRRVYEQEKLIFEATEQIAQLMEDENISKVELAKKIGKSKAYVTQLLSGSRNMTFKTFADILFALGHRAEINISPMEEKSIGQIIKIDDWQQKRADIKYNYNTTTSFTVKKLGIAG